MSADKIAVDSFLRENRVEQRFRDILEIGLEVVKTKKATVHPYGFYVLRIDESRQTQLRVHVWLKNFRRRQVPDWAAHNHNSDISSLVLVGCLKNTTWEIPSTDSSDRVLYEVEYDVGVSRLRKTNSYVAPRIRDSRVYESGDHYFLQRYLFHSADVEESCETISICCMKNPGPHSQHVVGDDSANDVYEFSRQAVSGKEFDAVREVLSKLSA